MSPANSLFSVDTSVFNPDQDLLFPKNALFDWCDSFRAQHSDNPAVLKAGARWDRAVHIAAMPGAVHCVDPANKLFLVQSVSDGFFYRVDLNLKPPQNACSCPDDKMHPDIPCKHRLAAVLWRVFIQDTVPFLKGDLCLVTKRSYACTATVKDIYGDWVKVDVDELRGRDNHRVTPFDDENGDPLYVLWLRWPSDNLHYI